MMWRAAELGGSCSIEANQPTGTRLVWEVPLTVGDEALSRRRRSQSSWWLRSSRRAASAAASVRRDIPSFDSRFET